MNPGTRRREPPGEHVAVRCPDVVLDGDLEEVAALARDWFVDHPGQVRPEER